MGFQKKEGPWRGEWDSIHTGMDRKAGRREDMGKKTGSRLET